MGVQREYPEQPVVGVGGVVIADGRALLIRRGSEPLKGQWSIPGGTLELAETLAEGVRRELREETGLEVRVLELIEVFERIFPDPPAAPDHPGGLHEKNQPDGQDNFGRAGQPRYHFVILDYLCEVVSGAARPGGDVTDVAFVREEDLARYNLTPAATRVLRKAFAMTRARAAKRPAP